LKNISGVDYHHKCSKQDKIIFQALKQVYKSPNGNHAGGDKKWKLPGIAGIMIAIGYILSPLSFYNDALVNIPLSVATAYLLHKWLNLDFQVMTAAAYIFSNILGLALMAWGFWLGKRKPDWRISPARTALTVLIYLLIAVLVSWLTQKILH